MPRNLLTLSSSIALLPQWLYNLWKISRRQALAKLTISLLYLKILNGPPMPTLLKTEVFSWSCLCLSFHFMFSSSARNQLQFSEPAMLFHYLYSGICCHLFTYLVKKNSYFFFKPYLSFIFSLEPSLTQHSMWEWATILSLLSSAILSLLYLSYSITISDSKVNEDSLTEETQYYLFVECNRSSNNIY